MEFSHCCNAYFHWCVKTHLNKAKWLCSVHIIIIFVVLRRIPPRAVQHTIATGGLSAAQ